MFNLDFSKQTLWRQNFNIKGQKKSSAVTTMYMSGISLNVLEGTDYMLEILMTLPIWP